jgi:hypothetical protein
MAQRVRGVRQVSKADILEERWQQESIRAA